ncbi:MAG: hypothetical protein AAGI52_16225 [Bacteroidota bacterium]
MIPGLLTDTVAPDVRDAVDHALLWGLETVALRTLGRERVPNTNEARLLRVLAEAEMPVAWIDPGLLEGEFSNRASVLGDIEALRDLAPFCHRIGCSVVAVGALAATPRETGDVVRSLRGAGEVAASKGLSLAVRNGDAYPSALDLAALLREVDHPAVGGLWSVAASRVARENLIASARALAEAGLLAVEADEELASADPEASGLVALARAGFAGPVVLAFSGRPLEGLAVSTGLVRSLRLSRRAARG